MNVATGLLGGHAHFLHWGVIQISLANVILVGLMVLLFVLALVVPFPHSDDQAAALGGTDVKR